MGFKKWTKTAPIIGLAPRSAARGTSWRKPVPASPRTDATAFSPTDVMPLARWAKLAMTVQATGSIVILGLVIARAVNILK